MTKKTFYLIYSIIFILNPLNLNTMSAQELNKQYGLFAHHSDIGNVKLAGNVTYNTEKQTYTLEGSGKNIWFGNDEFHYVWKKIKGDFILTAQVEFSGKGVEAHRKTGWMIRQSLDPGSPHISAVIHGDGLTSLQYRRKINGDMEEKRMTIQGPDIIQLSRQGNTYRMSVAHWGEPFVTEELIDSTITDDAYIGLFICSHNPDVSEKAVISFFEVL
jgi:TolB protein